jgi:cephalosporin-C deacetylase
MPLIDMPLAELERYTGRNPRPDDFDAFWDKALAEMRAVDAKVTLTPAAFRARGAECFDLEFTGIGGARQYAKFLRPVRPREKVPAVVVLHGYSGSSGDWSQYLAQVGSGMAVAALDCRGQGGRSEDVGGVRGNTLRGHIVRGLEDAPEKLLYRAMYLDAAQLAGIVMAMPEVDAGRVGAMGGSQGGGLTLACAALEPRIKRLAPTYPFLCDYQRVWEMDLAKDAYDELKMFFRMFDPRHERIGEWFRRLGYIDVQHLAPRIRGRVKMAVGLMDTVCPPSTQYAAYNKITAPKEVVIYPDFGHEGLPGWSDITFAFLEEM